MSRRRHKLKLAVERLEMTRGYDGFLRGHPEPAVLLGHFRAGGNGLVLTERLVARFQPRGRYPLVATLAEEARLQTRVSAIPDHLLLIVAFEEDGGLDLQRFHGLLEEAQALSVWDVGADLPAPVSLLDATRWSGGPRRVRLMEGTRDAAERCRSDKLIDAAVVPLERRLRRDTARVPLRSEDGRNDWTLDVRIEVTTL